MTDSAKPKDMPEESVPMRVICCILAVIAISCSFVFGKSPVPVIDFGPMDICLILISIWMCIGGCMFSYHYRYSIPKGVDIALKVAAAAISLNLMRELWLANQHSQQFECLYPLVDALTATSVVSCFELKSRKDILATSAFGLSLMALAGCSGRSILFGACVLLYIVLGAVLLCLCARSYAQSVSGKDVKPAYAATATKTSFGVLFSVLILPFASVAAFSFMPRADSIADKISAQVRSAVTAFIYAHSNQHVNNPNYQIADPNQKAKRKIPKPPPKPVEPEKPKGEGGRPWPLAPEDKKKPAVVQPGDEKKVVAQNPESKLPLPPMDLRYSKNGSLQVGEGVPASSLAPKNPKDGKKNKKDKKDTKAAGPKPPVKNPPATSKPKAADTNTTVPPLAGPDDTKDKGKEKGTQGKTDVAATASANPGKPADADKKAAAPADAKPEAKKDDAAKPPEDKAAKKPEENAAAPVTAHAVVVPVNMGKAAGPLTGITADSSVSLSEQYLPSNQVMFTLACNRQVYTKLMCLDSFDSHSWHRTDVAKTWTFDPNERGSNLQMCPFLEVSGALPVMELTENFELQSDIGEFVPVGGIPQHLSLLSRISVDRYGNVEASTPLIKGDKFTADCAWPTYSLEQMRIAPSYADVDDKYLERYLDLPKNQSDDVLDLAANLCQGGHNRFVQAESIVAYLRKNYKYNLDAMAGPPEANLVDQFLFQKKAGDCKAFASAFIVICRAAGIPARFVSGFAPGDVDPVTGASVVRVKHCHAWAEIYMEPYGWVPFDPTPGGLLPARPEQKYYNYEEVHRDVVSGFNTSFSQLMPEIQAVLGYVRYLVFALAGFAAIFGMILAIRSIISIIKENRSRRKYFHPAMKVRDRMLKGLARLEVERAPSDTGKDIIAKLERALESSEKAPSNPDEFQESVIDFFDTYNETVYGKADGMTRLKALCLSIEHQLRK